MSCAIRLVLSKRRANQRAQSAHIVALKSLAVIIPTGRWGEVRLIAVHGVAGYVAGFRRPLVTWRFRERLLSVPGQVSGDLPQTIQCPQSLAIAA